MSKEEMVESQPRSKAKVILLGLLVLFFVAMAFLVFSVARLVNTVNTGATSAIEPIGDRMRSLFVPATPVILPNPATVVKQIVAWWLEAEREAARDALRERARIRHHAAPLAPEELPALSWPMTPARKVVPPRL